MAFFKQPMEVSVSQMVVLRGTSSWPSVGRPTVKQISGERQRYLGTRKEKSHSEDS